MKYTTLLAAILLMGGCAFVPPGTRVYPATLEIALPTLVIPVDSSHYDDDNYWPHRPYDREEWVCDRYHERCWKKH